MILRNILRLVLRLGMALGVAFLLSGCFTKGEIISKDQRSSSGGPGSGGTADNFNQLKITNSSDAVYSVTSLSLNVGQTVTLKAASFNSASGERIEAKNVIWSVRNLSGDLDSGLSCGFIPVSTCSFTPAEIGSVIIEATFIGADSTLVNATAASPVVIVSSLSVANSMQITSGNLQTGTAGGDLSQPIKVRVLDSFAQPIQGIGVTFNVSGGGGSATPAAITTDANGYAETTWTVGTTAGVGNQALTALVTTNPAINQSFSASVTAAAVDHLEFTTQPAGGYSTLPLSSQPVVTAKDQYNNTVQVTDNVTLSLQTGTGALGGTLTKAMIAGVATFTDITYSKVENGIVARATSGSKTADSVAFNVITSGGTVDILPANYVLSPKFTHTSGVAGRVTSDNYTINGIDIPINITVTGPGNPKLKLNSGPEVDSLTGVSGGANIQVVADAPTVVGTKNIVTVYIGSLVKTFEVGLIDDSRVVMAFVTSSNWNGNLGGLSGGDTKCQSAATAAGISGSWSAILFDGTPHNSGRMPWNWGQMRRFDGAVIASDVQDFWDNSLQNPIGITETMQAKAGNVWVGFNSGGSHFNCSGWSSGSSGDTAQHSHSGGTIVNAGNITCVNTAALYCISDASAAPDTNPTDIDFLGDVVYASGGRSSSNVVTVSGVNTQINISITGQGNPKIKINGGAEVSSATATWGDTVQVVMDAPTVLGTKNTATINFGDDVETYTVGYADSSVTARMFVTNAAISGNASGLSGVDLACQNSATTAGLSGTWKGFVPATSAGGSLRNRTNFNWGSLQRLDSSVIANNWTDLWDGTISSPIQISELGINVGAWVVFSGAKANGEFFDGATCNDWSNSSGTVQTGSSGSMTSSWLNSTSVGCGNQYRYYCIEFDNVADDTPYNLFFGKSVAYSSGARTNSDVQTVIGIKGNISFSIAGAAGTPRVKINGGAEVASGTLKFGDTIQLVMDAPAILGTLNTATLTVGSSVYTWNVGYADSSKIARVFVSSAGYYANDLNVSTTADQKCSQAALSAGYLSGSWKALISYTNGTVRNSMPWNWGTLKRIDGATVANSFGDLWDGTLVNAVNLNEFSLINSESRIWTGSSIDGNVTSFNSGNWSISSTATVGRSTSSVSGWLNDGTYSSGSAQLKLYCIEDSDAGEDLVPNSLSIPYKVYQNTSTRITSDSVTITGITSAATITIGGSDGTPRVKINGGPEQNTGATINNGDSIQFVMDSPGVNNSSYKMTVTIGNGTAVPWRVWTGDPASGIKKRVFVTSTAHTGSMGGIIGADTICQTRANTNANLSSSTWKAIISGTSTGESDYAINRIGYLGSEWWTINPDGSFRSRVKVAADIWKAGAPIENRIEYNELGVSITSNFAVWTGTNENGLGNSLACLGWVWDPSSTTEGLSTSNSAWIYDGTGTSCYAWNRLYCIEQ